MAESISGHRSAALELADRIVDASNFSPTNVEDFLTNVNSNDYRPINSPLIVDAANTTYTNPKFIPTGVDALTSDNGEIVDISNSNVDLYNFVSQQQTINSNFDLIGSLINLNVGSFKSYTKII